MGPTERPYIPVPQFRLKTHLLTSQFCERPKAENRQNHSSLKEIRQKKPHNCERSPHEATGTPLLWPLQLAWETWSREGGPSLLLGCACGSLQPCCCAHCCSASRIQSCRHFAHASGTEYCMTLHSPQHQLTSPRLHHHHIKQNRNCI